MAYQEKFIALAAGQWVPICEQNDQRQSLIASMIGGDVVLGTTQAAPFVASVDGVIPAGIFLQGGDAGGSGMFRTSVVFDADIATQEWFAWLIPGTSGGGGGATIYTDSTIPQTGLFSLNTFNLPAGLRVVYTVAGNTGPGAITCTSAADGAIAAAATWTISDGSTDSCILTLFWWESVGGIDTVTFQLAGTDQGGAAIIAGPGLSLDVSGLGAGTVSPVFAQTTGAAASVGEIVTTAFLVLFAASVGSESMFPDGVWVDAGNEVLFSTPDGSAWGMGAAYQLAAAPVVQFVTWTATNPTLSVVCPIVAFSLSAPAQAALISVFESFAITDPPPPENTFQVSLPRLSQAAYESLQGLAKKVQSQVILPNQDAGDAN